MKPLTLVDLRAIFPHASSAKLSPFVDGLNAAMEEFGIDTSARQAAFLAQVGHESGSFTYLKELASGDAYEGRANLGNTEEGDGRKFKGRGLLQITGRKNYGLCGDALNLDLLESPELLEVPENAVRSAAWFWVRGAGLNLSKRAIQYGVQPDCNLNDLADAEDFMGITLAINGGTNGLAERQAFFDKAQQVLA